jgi:hypothetical protein
MTCFLLRTTFLMNFLQHPVTTHGYLRAGLENLDNLKDGPGEKVT